MVISKIKINNFKSFKNEFQIKFLKDINILVGLNEAGKSTIMEAIHLACSGILDGKLIKNEVSQNIFNEKVVHDYIKNLNRGEISDLPEIAIEIFLEDLDDELYKGDGNSEKDGALCGFVFKIAFNDSYKTSYSEFIKNYSEVKSLPVEYYDVSWMTFARKNILPRDIMLRSAFIDSSVIKSQSGCDVHFAKILKDTLVEEDRVSISQAHRKMLDAFRSDSNVIKINDKINYQSQISQKNISVSVDLQTKNAWERTLTTLLDGIPYSYIGKGEQAIVKTNLALVSKNTQKAAVILLEEPENHLTFSKLNSLIKTIKDNNKDKQIIMTTHSSFVANKLGLNYLILIHAGKIIDLKELNEDTYNYFCKISGYDTLRLILSPNTILVEGASDELIVQRAFKDQYGCLPIEREIDVMSVGLSFLRFLQIAEKLNKTARVITDNDGNIEAVEKKYIDYLGSNKKTNIEICFDSVLDKRTEIDGKSFNFNTLEPLLVRENNLDTINKVLETEYKNEEELLKYMNANKTEVALKIFDSKESIKYPEYILASFKDLIAHE